MVLCEMTLYEMVHCEIAICDLVLWEMVFCELVYYATIGSYVRVRSSRYEARGKFGEHERCLRDAWGVAKSNSSFLSALQTSQVLHISMNAQLTYEPIVL